MSALGVAAVPLTCPASASGSCRGLVELIANSEIVASSGYVLLPSSTIAVHLSLSPEIHAFVARRHSLGVTGLLDATDDGGGTATVSQHITLTTPRPHFVVRPHRVAHATRKRRVRHRARHKRRPAPRRHR